MRALRAPGVGLRWSWGAGGQGSLLIRARGSRTWASPWRESEEQRPFSPPPPPPPSSRLILSPEFHFPGREQRPLAAAPGGCLMAA